MYYTNNEDYLAHHGVLGQKWGIRRFQNEDGSLTTAGKEHYRPDRVIGNIHRAFNNTSISQRVIGVGLNRGYRRDRKEIKDLYKEKTKEIRKSDKSFSDKREELKSLKSDYKKTRGEARTSAAQALYPWQNDKTNEKIQNESLGKAVVKTLLLGPYGHLTYNRLTSDSRVKKGEAAVGGLVASTVDSLLYGTLNVGDYAYNKIKYNKKSKGD